MPKWQNFPPAAGLNSIYTREKWPAAGGKFWHFEVQNTDFTRGNGPPQAENFGILGSPNTDFTRENEHFGGLKNLQNLGSGPRTPKTPPLLRTRFSTRGGFSARDSSDPLDEDVLSIQKLLSSMRSFVLTFLFLVQFQQEFLGKSVKYYNFTSIWWCAHPLLTIRTSKKSW